MKDNPKQPRADAVVLYRQVDVDEGKGSIVNKNVRHCACVVPNKLDSWLQMLRPCGFFWTDLTLSGSGVKSVPRPTRTR